MGVNNSYRSKLLMGEGFLNDRLESIVLEIVPHEKLGLFHVFLDRRALAMEGEHRVEELGFLRCEYFLAYQCIRLLYKHPNHRHEMQRLISLRGFGVLPFVFDALIKPQHLLKLLIFFEQLLLLAQLLLLFGLERIGWLGLELSDVRELLIDVAHLIRYGAHKGNGVSLFLRE